MKAHYRTKSGRISFEVEAQTFKQLFQAIAETQEVFEADTNCGCCNSANIRFRVRSAQDNEFYEIYCEDCTATLSFGQTRQGNKLYAKRKDNDGTPIPNRGWRVWRRGESESFGNGR